MDKKLYILKSNGFRLLISCGHFNKYLYHRYISSMESRIRIGINGLIQRFLIKFKMSSTTAKNSTFSKEQICFITIQFLQGKTTLDTRRNFRSKFKAKNPRDVPSLSAFGRVKKRLQENGSGLPLSKNPKKNVTAPDCEIIARVKP